MEKKMKNSVLENPANSRDRENLRGFIFLVKGVYFILNYETALSVVIFAGLGMDWQAKTTTEKAVS